MLLPAPRPPAAPELSPGTCCPALWRRPPWTAPRGAESSRARPLAGRGPVSGSARRQSRCGGVSRGSRGFGSASRRFEPPPTRRFHRGALEVAPRPRRASCRSALRAGRRSPPHPRPPQARGGFAARRPASRRRLCDRRGAVQDRAHAPARARVRAPSRTACGSRCERRGESVHRRASESFRPSRVC